MIHSPLSTSLASARIETLSDEMPLETPAEIAN